MKRLLLPLLLCISAAAETYYIDFVDGDNSTNGICSTSAWKHVPGDPNATGNPAAYVIQPGDRFLFKGGVNYDSTIQLSRSGTPGFPITYDGNSAGTFGAGWALIDRGYKGTNIFTPIGNVSNIVVQNFQIQKVGGVDLNIATNFIWLDNPCIEQTPPLDNIGVNTSTPETPFIRTAKVFAFANTQPRDLALNNLIINEIGVWTNAACWDGGSTTIIDGIAFDFDNVHNLVISNALVSNLSRGIGLGATGAGQGVSNVLVTAYAVTGRLRWGLDISTTSSGAKFQNITIEKSFFTNYPYYNAGYWAGCNNNNSDNPHTDGIFLRNNDWDDASTWTNVVIRNNVFGCDIDSGEGGTGEIYISLGPSADIYNNLFLKAAHTAVIRWNSKPAAVPYQRVRIWNNTFIGGPRQLHYAATLLQTNNVVIDIRNNAFWRNNTSGNPLFIENATGTPIFDSNYNMFWHDTRNSPTLFHYDWITPHSIQWVRDNASMELNSLLIDLKLQNINIDSVFNGNYMPDATSPLRGAGQNLTSEFTTDFYGRARPAVGAWDVGAIQFYEGP